MAVPCRTDGGLEFEIVCYGVDIKDVTEGRLEVPLADRLVARGLRACTMYLTKTKRLETPWRIGRTT